MGAGFRVEIGEAIEILRAGELVAFPTETVYGLGASVALPLALRRVFAAKGRPVDHPLIIHLADAQACDAVVDWAKLVDGGSLARRLMARFWPGPLTLVLPRRVEIPDEVCGGLPTVGVRVPDHERARTLLAAFPLGLAAPSANRFGRVSPTCAEHVWAELGDALPVVDGGACAVGLESTIVDLSDPEGPSLLRSGGLALEEIEALTGPLPRGRGKAPGTLAAHYAPRTSLLVTEQPQVEAARLAAQGLKVALLENPGNVADYARMLYAELRRLDGLGLDVLVAERAPEAGLGRALNDRLARAAFGSGS